MKYSSISLGKSSFNIRDIHSRVVHAVNLSIKFDDIFVTMLYHRFIAIAIAIASVRCVVPYVTILTMIPINLRGENAEKEKNVAYHCCLWHRLLTTPLI